MIAGAEDELVNVSGFEPPTPCLQTRGKAGSEKSKSLFGLRLAHESTRTVPRIAPNLFQGSAETDRHKIEVLPRF